jgi:hypothetical protein
MKNDFPGGTFRREDSKSPALYSESDQLPDFQVVDAAVLKTEMC